MKKFKFLSAVCAAAMAMAAVSFNAFAEEGEIVKVEPICEHVIKTDINGIVLVYVPEEVTADIKIVYSSPEPDNHEYYTVNAAGGKSYAFDIEGKDNTEDDYRNYIISIQLTGGKYGATSAAYTDIFTVPDVNDNPDSYRELRYNFSIDDERSDNDWDVVKDEADVKDIAVHLDRIIIGDVDGNRSVDASDASKVLAEYAAVQTGRPSVLDERAKIAADVNSDSKIDSSDASKILAYYSVIQTGGTPSWK